MAQPATSSHSDRQRLVEHQLGTSIVRWVDIRRETGVKAWRRLAVDLGNETGVYVTHETLRNWYRRAKGAVAT